MAIRLMAFSPIACRTLRIGCGSHTAQHYCAARRKGVKGNVCLLRVCAARRSHHASFRSLQPWVPVSASENHHLDPGSFPAARPDLRTQSLPCPGQRASFRSVIRQDACVVLVPGRLPIDWCKPGQPAVTLGRCPPQGRFRPLQVQPCRRDALPTGPGCLTLRRSFFDMTRRAAPRVPGPPDGGARPAYRRRECRAQSVVSIVSKRLRSGRQ
jgi:hypothetical protein